MSLSRREFLAFGAMVTGIPIGYKLGSLLGLGEGKRLADWSNLPYYPYLHSCGEGADLSSIPSVTFPAQTGRKLCEPAVAITGDRTIVGAIDTEDKPNDQGRKTHPLFLGIAQGRDVTTSSVTFPGYDESISSGGDPLIAVLPNKTVAVISMFESKKEMGNHLALSVLDADSSTWTHDLLDLGLKTPYTMVDKPWFYYGDPGWLVFVAKESRNGKSYNQIYLYHKPIKISLSGRLHLLKQKRVTITDGRWYLPEGTVFTYFILNSKLVFNLETFL